MTCFPLLFWSSSSSIFIQYQLETTVLVVLPAFLYPPCFNRRTWESHRPSTVYARDYSQSDAAKANVCFLMQ